MTAMRGKSNQIAFILAIVAALLAWTAAAVRYFRSGEIDWTPLAAGLFLLALAFSLRGRSGARPD